MICQGLFQDFAQEGQTDFKRGQIQILRGGQPHIKYRESQLPSGGQINPKGGGGRKHPLAPEINPVCGPMDKFQ